MYPKIVYNIYFLSIARGVCAMWKRIVSSSNQRAQLEASWFVYTTTPKKQQQHFS